MSESTKVEVGPQYGTMNTDQTDGHDGDGHSHGHMKNTHSDLDGAFKAAVFGFSDGLCTNVNVILAMYAAMASGSLAPVSQIRHIIWLTGLSGLLGGASSMACGEWLSDNAQKEQHRHELKKEAWHHLHIPEVESRDMHQLMRQAGLSKNTCDSICADLDKMPTNERVAFHARFELGIEEEDANLLTSLRCAVFMWVSFAVGAFIPLVPWILAPSTTSLNTLFVLTIIASALAIMGTSMFQASQISEVFSVVINAKTFVKQLIIVAIAVGVTVGLNLMITGSVGG